MERSPNRLEWTHWQALLACGLRDAETQGLPDATRAYLRANLLYEEPLHWRPFGNGWALMTGHDGGKRAK
jgi:hypothetical protein